MTRRVSATTRNYEVTVEDPNVHVQSGGSCCKGRMSHRLEQVLGAFVALVVVSGCRGASSPPAPVSTAAAVSPDTWAAVDGREIKRDEVEKAFRRSRTAAAPMSDEQALEAKLTLLNDLIIEDILLARAQRQAIDVPGAEIDKAYAEAKQNISDEAFQKELSQRDLTIADLRERLRRELVVRKLMEQEIGSKVTITDQDVTDFFNANRPQFDLAEDTFHLAQIVVTPVRDSQTANRRGDDATTPQAAGAKIAMLMGRLKEGATFAELAMDYSEDPESAARGGDLGLIPLSGLKQAPPALRDAVLQTKPGAARVVTQPGGHAIVFVVAKEPAGQRDLSTPGVRDNIMQGLQQRKEQLLRAAYVTAAQDEANVVNYLARRIVESRGAVPPSVLPAR